MAVAVLGSINRHTASSRQPNPPAPAPHCTQVLAPMGRDLWGFVLLDGVQPRQQSLPQPSPLPDGAAPQALPLSHEPSSQATWTHANKW